MWWQNSILVSCLCHAGEFHGSMMPLLKQLFSLISSCFLLYHWGQFDENIYTFQHVLYGFSFKTDEFKWFPSLFLFRKKMATMSGLLVLFIAICLWRVHTLYIVLKLSCHHSYSFLLLIAVKINSLKRIRSLKRNLLVSWSLL